MNKSKKKKLLVLIVLLLFINISAIIAFVAVQVYGKSTNQTHRVVLTKDGFSSSSLTIKLGDTITFSTTAGREFWPASNLHPTHEIYAAFDPKLPIGPDKTWSFTFNKEGSWKFHDHLAPMFSGEITVVKGGGQAQNFSPQDTCTTITNKTKRTQCIDAFFSKVLAEKGVSGGFDLLDSFSKKDPSFAANCHDFAHRLGQKAYEVFSKDKKVVLSEKSSYCGYGFYHGFMGALMYQTGNIYEARDFCNLAEKTLREKNADAGGACYHGIGHGINEVPDQKTWGNAQKIIAPALALCAKISPDTMKKFRCDTGVFNALEIFMTNNQYRLSLNPTDPYWICKAQKDEHKEACYTQMVVALLSVTNNDFAQSATFINEIQNDPVAISAMGTLVIELVHLNRYDNKGNVDFCRSLAQRFQAVCIRSIAEGLMKYGPPQNEYKDALQFCNDSLLTGEEKKLALAGFYKSFVSGIQRRNRLKSAKLWIRSISIMDVNTISMGIDIGFRCSSR